MQIPIQEYSFCWNFINEQMEGGGLSREIVGQYLSKKYLKVGVHSKSESVYIISSFKFDMNILVTANYEL